MKYQLDRGCHSVYSLRFHYVCCVKCRRKVLTPEISEYLKMVNEDIAGKFGVQIIEQETDRDHIHIIFASKPQVQLSGFINRLKSASAKRIPKIPGSKSILMGRPFLVSELFFVHRGRGETGGCQTIRPVPKQSVTTSSASTPTKSRSASYCAGWGPAGEYITKPWPGARKPGSRETVPSIGWGTMTMTWK